MKGKIISGLALLWLFSFVTAAVVTIMFSTGVIWTDDNHSGTAGAANVGTRYWVASGSSGGFSTSPANATPVFDINANGNLLFAVDSNSGDCGWFGVLKNSAPTDSDGRINVVNLNGTAVNDSQFLYLAAIPTKSGISQCSMNYDANVTTV